MADQVPLVDLHAAHAEIADEVSAGFADVIARTAFVGGPQVGAFERSYADYIGVAHCIGVANGTDAIEIAVRATGLRPGDEVVVPANTFVATVEAIVRAGGVPAFADATPDGVLDVASAAEAITPRTVGIVPVHLYGQMPDMAAVQALAQERGLWVVEDAAQSQGASQDGRRAGALGLLAGTSFYPGKNLGAYGDAGAVLTDDDAAATAARLMANHGSARRYEHEVFGFNSRLDTLQAVVLAAKLTRLDHGNERRRAAADRYAGLLAGQPGIVLPRTVPGNVHVWHLYVVQVPDRDAVLARLQAAGIGAGIHYPVPVHLQPPYAAGRYGPGDFPVTEEMAARILSLPLFPQITAEQQERVVAALLAALG